MSQVLGLRRRRPDAGTAAEYEPEAKQSPSVRPSLRQLSDALLSALKMAVWPSAVVSSPEYSNYLTARMEGKMLGWQAFRVVAEGAYLATHGLCYNNLVMQVFLLGHLASALLHVTRRLFWLRWREEICMSMNIMYSVVSFLKLFNVVPRLPDESQFLMKYCLLYLADAYFCQVPIHKFYKLQFVDASLRWIWWRLYDVMPGAPYIALIATSLTWQLLLLVFSSSLQASHVAAFLKAWSAASNPAVGASTSMAYAPLAPATPSSAAAPSQAATALLAAVGQGPSSYSLQYEQRRCGQSAMPHGRETAGHLVGLGHHLLRSSVQLYITAADPKDLPVDWLQRVESAVQQGAMGWHVVSASARKGSLVVHLDLAYTHLRPSIINLPPTPCSEVQQMQQPHHSQSRQPCQPQTGQEPRLTTPKEFQLPKSSHEVLEEYLDGLDATDVLDMLGLHDELLGTRPELDTISVQSGTSGRVRAFRAVARQDLRPLKESSLLEEDANRLTDLMLTTLGMDPTAVVETDKSGTAATAAAAELAMHEDATACRVGSPCLLSPVAPGSPMESAWGLAPWSTQSAMGVGALVKSLSTVDDAIVALTAGATRTGDINGVVWKVLEQRDTAGHFRGIHPNAYGEQAPLSELDTVPMPQSIGHDGASTSDPWDVALGSHVVALPSRQAHTVHLSFTCVPRVLDELQVVLRHVSPSSFVTGVHTASPAQDITHTLASTPATMCEHPDTPLRFDANLALSASRQDMPSLVHVELWRGKRRLCSQPVVLVAAAAVPAGSQGCVATAGCHGGTATAGSQEATATAAGIQGCGATAGPGWLLEVESFTKDLKAGGSTGAACQFIEDLGSWLAQVAALERGLISGSSPAVARATEQRVARVLHIHHLTGNNLAMEFVAAQPSTTVPSPQPHDTTSPLSTISPLSTASAPSIDATVYDVAVDHTASAVRQLLLCQGRAILAVAVEAGCLQFARHVKGVMGGPLGASTAEVMAGAVTPVTCLPLLHAAVKSGSTLMLDMLVSWHTEVGTPHVNVWADGALIRAVSLTPGVTSSTGDGGNNGGGGGSSGSIGGSSGGSDTAGSHSITVAFKLKEGLSGIYSRGKSASGAGLAATVDRDSGSSQQTGFCRALSFKPRAELGSSAVVQVSRELHDDEAAGLRAGSSTLDCMRFGSGGSSGGGGSAGGGSGGSHVPSTQPCVLTRMEHAGQNGTRAQDGGRAQDGRGVSMAPLVVEMDGGLVLITPLHLALVLGDEGRMVDHILTTYQEARELWTASLSASHRTSWGVSNGRSSSSSDTAATAAMAAAATASVVAASDCTVTASCTGVSSNGRSSGPDASDNSPAYTGGWSASQGFLLNSNGCMMNGVAFGDTTVGSVGTGSGEVSNFHSTISLC